MAGYREFQTGEVLTAANVDDFLAKQAVMKFADSAARDTALGTAVAGGNALREGMASYLDDTNEFEVYDGTSWNGLGGLVAVKFVVKTDTFSASVAAGANAAITGLSISHAVADAANKVYLISTMTGSQSDVDRTNFALAADGTLLDVGDTVGSRTSVGGSNSGSTNEQSSSVTLLAEYTPGSTSSVTYDGRVVCVRGGATTIYVNRSRSDADLVYVSRDASTLMLLEVKV